jgi:hypothetical protein
MANPPRERKAQPSDLILLLFVLISMALVIIELLSNLLSQLVG